MTALNVIIVVQSVAAAIGLLTILLLLQQKPSSLQKISSITAVCSFIGLISYMFEILATSKEEAFLAARFGYIGKSYAMVLFLFFICIYCDIKLSGSLKMALVGFSTVLMLVVITSPLHKLYYTSVDYVDTGLFSHLELGKGPLYYIFMAFQISIIFWVLGIVIKTLKKRAENERLKLILFCLAGIMPAIALVLNILSMFKGFDPTPIGIMFSCVFIGVSVLKYGLQDTMQLAGESVMNYTGEGLIVVNKHKKFIFANQKALEVFPSLKYESVRETVLDKLFSHVTEDNMESKTYTNNDIIYELRYSVLYEKEQNGKSSNDGSSGFVAWIFDMTADYNYTKELERLRDEAENANRAKTMFLANMSHEIRTPMNGIIGFANLALESSKEKETVEYLSYIKSSGDALLKIINDVLDISKIESGKMEIVNVEYNPKQLISDVAVLMEGQAQAKKLLFNVNVSDNIPIALCGDSTRFREILINIVGNAIKYTKEGKVDLDIKVEDIDDIDVQFVIHVVDTGIGIKPDRIDAIFETFEQADNVENYHVEGTGLGLSISRKLAELMGGSLMVSSEYGKGSDFCLIIPQKRVLASTITNTSYDAFDSALSDSSTIIADNVNVIVVDDNEINLKVAKSLLKRYEIDVDLAISGIECLEKIEEKKYDVILMDQMMPGMDGIETFDRIRNGDSINKNTPVLLVTANAIVGVKQEMLDKGFNGFVTKPIDEKMLEKTLLDVLPEKITLIKLDEEYEEENKCDNEYGELISALEKAGVETKSGIKYCGSIEDYVDVLRIAQKTASDKIIKLENLYDQRDWENYTIVVHSMKSGAANIGANNVSSIARELENAGRIKDERFIDENTMGMLEEYKHIISVISDNLPDEEKRDMSVSPDDTDISGTTWEKMLSDLEYLLDELENDQAVELAKDIMTNRLGDEAEHLLMQIIQSLDIFDIELAKQYLEELKKIEISI